jgi:hypothetical protein
MHQERHLRRRDIARERDPPVMRAPARHREPLGRQPVTHLRNIVVARAELLIVFVGRQELMILRRFRILLILQKLFELRLIARVQIDLHLQRLIGRHRRFLRRQISCRIRMISHQRSETFRPRRSRREKQ